MDENEKSHRFLGKKLTVINVGLSSFEEALKEQGAEVITVRWRPPHNIRDDIEPLLKKML